MPETIFTTENLIKAYLDCRKSKRQTTNALKYELDLENNLDTLRNQLASRTYEPSRSIRFIVTVPKPREIFAADFSDRVVHHVLINEIENLWEKDIFIVNSYACRKEKGHHFGVKRVFIFAKNYQYFGQFDIANFFSNIDKSVLFKLIKDVVVKQKKPDWWKNDILWLVRAIIFNDPTVNYLYKGNPGLVNLLPKGKSLLDQDKGTGLPIGNLTSQFFANVYLNELDHYVTENLKIPAYGRYVDDFLVFCNNKREIIKARNRIQIFLVERLKLILHPKKQQIQLTCHGIPFVGYFIKPWGITIRRNVVRTAKNKIYRFNKSGEVRKAVVSLNSYFGHFGKAKSAHLRKHLIEKHLCSEIKSQITVIGNWHHLGS